MEAEEKPIDVSTEKYLCGMGESVGFAYDETKKKYTIARIEAGQKYLLTPIESAKDRSFTTITFGAVQYYGVILNSMA